jgi:hypothetical protein
LLKNILLCILITPLVFAAPIKPTVAPTKDQLITALKKSIDEYRIKSIISAAIIIGCTLGFPATHLLIFGSLLTKGVYFYKNPPHKTAQALFPNSALAQRIYTIASYLCCGVGLCSLGMAIYSIYKCIKLNKELAKLKEQEKIAASNKPTPLKQLAPSSIVALPHVRNRLA